MNLRCRNCSTLFALSMAEKSAALQMMQRENMQHYDAYCPRCRRSNPIPRALLERFSPGWQNYVAGSTAAGTRTAAAQPKPAATALQPASAGAKTAAAGPAQAKNGGKAKPKPAGKGKPAAKKPSSSKVKAKPAPNPKSTSKAKAKKGPARKKK